MRCHEGENIIMRRMLIAVGLAAVALAGAAACDKSTPNPAGSAGADVAAATRDACTQATALSATGAAEFNTKMNEFLQAAASGDAAKGQQLEAEIRAKVTEWATKLDGLAAKDVKPEVKTALTEAATTLRQHNDPNDSTSIDEVKAAYVAIATKISTACA